MSQQLEQVLRTVPFLSTLGIRVEQARPGHIVLRLPHLPENTDVEGNLHTGTLFAVGELAAGVALGTHPQLIIVTSLIRGTCVKYLNTASGDVTAHATIGPEIIDAIMEGVADRGKAETDVPVQIHDGHGGDVAELMVRYVFKPL